LGQSSVPNITLPLANMAYAESHATNTRHTFPSFEVSHIGFSYTSATGKIKRSDFGMQAFLPAIGDEVILEIQAKGFREAS
jgi:polyisoprenoid-binding protein YceI